MNESLEATKKARSIENAVWLLTWPMWAEDDSPAAYQDMVITDQLNTASLQVQHPDSQTFAPHKNVVSLYDGYMTVCMC